MEKFKDLFEAKVSNICKDEGCPVKAVDDFIKEYKNVWKDEYKREIKLIAEDENLKYKENKTNNDMEFDNGEGWITIEDGGFLIGQKGLKMKVVSSVMGYFSEERLVDVTQNFFIGEDEILGGGPHPVQLEEIDSVIVSELQKHRK